MLYSIRHQAQDLTAHRPGETKRTRKSKSRTLNLLNFTTHNFRSSAHRMAICIRSAIRSCAVVLWIGSPHWVQPAAKILFWMTCSLPDSLSSRVFLWLYVSRTVTVASSCCPPSTFACALESLPWWAYLIMSTVILVTLFVVAYGIYMWTQERSSRWDPPHATPAAPLDASPESPFEISSEATPTSTSEPQPEAPNFDDSMVIDDYNPDEGEVRIWDPYGSWLMTQHDRWLMTQHDHRY